MSWQERRIRNMAHVRRYIAEFGVHQNHSRRRLLVIVLAVVAGLVALGVLVHLATLGAPHAH